MSAPTNETSAPIPDGWSGLSEEEIEAIHREGDEAEAALRRGEGIPRDEVLALADLAMDPVEDQRLSALLDRQQAGELRADERVELIALMQAYQDGLLRKAQALHEAVRRGLRAPLDP